MLPLQGIKVMEVAQSLSGPYADEIPDTLGADVLKVERPGDDARGWGPPFVAAAATAFRTANRYQRSITVDLKQPGDRTRLRALVMEAELLVQAFSRLFVHNGRANGPLSRIQVQVLDLGTGLWAAMAKAGVPAMIRSLVITWGPYGIRTGPLNRVGLHREWTEVCTVPGVRRRLRRDSRARGRRWQQNGDDLGRRRVIRPRCWPGRTHNGRRCGPHDELPRPAFAMPKMPGPRCDGPQSSLMSVRGKAR